MVVHLLDEMPHVKVTPNVVSYTAAVSACEKGGQWQIALYLLDEMPLVKVTPEVNAYCAAMTACERGGQWQAALSLFQQMQTNQISANNVAYNALLNSAEICNSKRGGYIFRYGYLPMLSGPNVFREEEVDLHELSEGVG